MKVCIDKIELKKAVGVSKNYLPAKPLVEVDGHILFDVKEGTVVISATDNQQACFIELSIIESEGIGKFSCDPKRLEKALAKTNCISVMLEHDDVEMGLKVGSNEERDSFITLHTLPISRMSVYKPALVGDNCSAEMNRKVFYTGIKYIQAFTPHRSAVSKKFDFAIINNGILYAANGVNKRGYFVCREMQGLQNVCIQKKFLETLGRSLNTMLCDKVTLTERNNVISVESDDGSCKIYMTKSRYLPPEMPKQYIKVKGDPYTVVVRDQMIKSIDRSTVASYAKLGTPMGVQLTLSGTGSDSKLKTDMITNTLKTIDTIPCERVADDEGEEITNLIEYKLFKTILSSFSKEGETRLYINQPEVRFFKVYTKAEIEDISFAEIGVGSYSRRVR